MVAISRPPNIFAVLLLALRRAHFGRRFSNKYKQRSYRTLSLRSKLCVRTFVRTSWNREFVHEERYAVRFQPNLEHP